MIINRLKLYIDYLNISVSAFERSIGASDSTIRKAITNQKDISTKWISKISEKFPDIDMNWLIYGEGKMIKTKEIEINNEVGVSIPVYNIEASAGQGIITSSQYITSELKLEFAKEGDISIPIYGDSMSPIISSGDLVVLRPCDYREYIPYGHAFVLDTKDGIYCKYIKRNESSNDHLLLRSANSKYDDFEIPYSFVKNIYIVVAIIRKIY